MSRAPAHVRRWLFLLGKWALVTFLCRVRIDAAQIPLFRNDAKALRARPDSLEPDCQQPAKENPREVSMNLPQDELRALLNLGLVILLPMVPAFVLFKALPGTAVVSGPLQGLNIKLGGAFAGYFALLILVFSTHKIWNPAPGEIWEVSGKVVDENGAVIKQLTAKDIGLIPNSVNAYENGTFKLTVASMPTQGGGIEFPQVTVGHEDFQPTTIPLDPSDVEAAHMGLVRDGTKHQIRIPPIHLKKLPEYSATVAAEKVTIATKGAQP
jgi:hypothetical protein